jgi:hypothetical protein
VKVRGRIKLMLTNLRLVWSQPKAVALQVAGAERIAQSFAALSPSPCPIAALSLSLSPCPFASALSLSFARPAHPLAALSLPAWPFASARQALAPS